jgi:SagB-type dehydrogenase family enzyme
MHPEYKRRLKVALPSGMTSLEYHNATKHTPESVRRSARPLDWANMPDPFRHYEGAPLIDLAADPLPPPITALDVLRGVTGAPSGGDPIDFLSRLLFYSASVSASKQTPSGYRYALRVNPSSGNLHPTEFHFASPQGRFHYRPSTHMLEHRSMEDCGPLDFLLTTIACREAWKYGNRAYRYCLLDAGHAWQALALAAQALGCEAVAIGQFDDDAAADAFRLAEDEWPILRIRLLHAPEPAPARERWWAGGTPNRLSDHRVEYPLIDSVHTAAKILAPDPARTAALRPPSALGIGPQFGDVVRRRRSALDFIGQPAHISHEQFLTLLQVAMRPLHADFGPYVDLYAFVHSVAGLEPGLYRYDRETDRLELVKSGDERVMAAALSLSQDLAGNSCVTFSMAANLRRAIDEFGDRGYRYAHFEAGAIGQRLYLAAEALGFQSTGIGAFYDDLVHQYLGLRPEQGQVVYHFACGFAVKDDRIDGIVTFGN